MTDIDTLLKRHPLVSDQVGTGELRVVLRELQRVLDMNVAGDVVELGCYEGTTALFLQRVLVADTPRRSLVLFDSFEGLPAKTRQDASSAGDQFKAGELRASKSRLINHFKHAGLPMPRIRKAWFSDLTPADMPEAIAFAFLDGDFYESITDSLRVVWPRLSRQATVVIDDYQTEALPGVRRAVDEWSRSHEFSLRTEASLAVLRLL